MATKRNIDELKAIALAGYEAGVTGNGINPYRDKDDRLLWEKAWSMGCSMAVALTAASKGRK